MRRGWAQAPAPGEGGCGYTPSSPCPYWAAGSTMARNWLPQRPRSPYAVVGCFSKEGCCWYYCFLASKYINKNL